MRRWVMFGHNHFFGDFVDIITDTGGRLTRVVQNVPQVKVPGRPTLEERILRLPGIWDPVEILQLKEFAPKDGESYIVGFTLQKMQPLVEDLKRRFQLRFPALAHRSAIIQMGAVLADGVILDAGAIVGSWARVGQHTVVSRGANVGHDCRVGNYCYLGTAAVLCGHAQIGDDVLVGANATVLPDVRVGSGVVIAAGAVVTKDVPDSVMVAGVPAVVKRMQPD